MENPRLEYLNRDRCCVSEENGKLWKGIVNAFLGGIGKFFNAIWRIFHDIFEPDNPPPDPEIPPLRRCCATISGAVFSLLLIFVVLAFIFRDEQRLRTLTEAVGGYVGTCSIALAFIELLLAIYWGRDHNDRSEYKLLVSSALLTIFFPVTLLVLLSLLTLLVDMILL